MFCQMIPLRNARRAELNASSPPLSPAEFPATEQLDMVSVTTEYELHVTAPDENVAVFDQKVQLVTLPAFQAAMPPPKSAVL